MEKYVSLQKSMLVPGHMNRVCPLCLTWGQHICWSSRLLSLMLWYLVELESWYLINQCRYNTDGRILIHYLGIKGQCCPSDNWREGSAYFITWELRGICFDHWREITCLCFRGWYEEYISRTCYWLCICYMLPLITKTEGTGGFIFFQCLSIFNNFSSSSLFF